MASKAHRQQNEVEQVSIPYKSGQHFKTVGGRPDGEGPAGRFNPLQIGSTLQNVSVRRDPHAADEFQSPTNRVNTSKCSGVGYGRVGGYGFQSPTNRVNTSKRLCVVGKRSTCRIDFNPLQIGSTLQKREGRETGGVQQSVDFNPLQIGSTLQNSRPAPPRGSAATPNFNPLQIGSTLQKQRMSTSWGVSPAPISIPYKSGQHFKKPSGSLT